MEVTAVSLGQELLTLLTIVMSVSVMACVFFRSRRPKGFPPGPPTSWMPFVGNFREFKEKDKRIPFRKYRPLYGNIYSLCIGSKLVVIVCGYEAIKETFVDRGELFTDRPQLYLLEIVTGGKGIGGASGSLWKEHRHFGLSVFKSLPVKRAQFLNDIIQQALRMTLQDLQQYINQSVDVADTVSSSCFSFVSSLCFGSSYKAEDDRFRETRHLFEATLEPLMSTPVNMFPALRLIPGDPFNCRDLIENSQKILTNLRKFVEERETSLLQQTGGDYAGVFLREMRRLDDLGTESTFTYEQLIISLWDLYVGGLVATRKVLLWVIAYLAKYPEWQDHIYSEVTKVSSRSSSPGIEDKGKLVMTEAFIMETLRHAKVTITGLPKNAVEDTQISGYYIPKGTTILPDIDSVFNDPDIWTDPEDFNPNRFISTDGRLMNPVQFIPFSIGLRSCLGEAAVKIYLVMFVASLIKKIHIEIPSSEEFSLGDLDGTFAFAHGPKSYNITPVDRP